MQVKGLSILVVGLARSGVALVRYLTAQGAEVTLTDLKTEEELREILAELPGDVNTHLGGQPETTEGYDLVILSPGVPPTIPLVKRAIEEQVEVIGELELGYRQAKASFIGITGTNGKTTTTSLVGYLFELAEREHAVVGNIGTPVISMVEEVSEDGWFVCEVSSFQLETTVDFTPKIAAILNITPDHLNRHGTMSAYVEAKSRLFENQTYTDWVVLNYDDPYTRALGKLAPSNVLYFSRQEALANGVYLDKGAITVSENGEHLALIDREELSLPGDHNLENAMAAVAIAYLAKIPFKTIVKGLRTFAGVPHRIERIATCQGVTYYNDSKATNPEAAIVGLKAFDVPVNLLAGGMDKGSNFTAFARFMSGRVKRAALIGETREALAEAIANEAPQVETATFDLLDDAVGWLAAGAVDGEVVLLSPACASWDMYESYEHRGDHFKSRVGELTCKEKASTGTSSSS